MFPKINHGVSKVSLVLLKSDSVCAPIFRGCRLGGLLGHYQRSLQCGLRACAVIPLTSPPATFLTSWSHLQFLVALQTAETTFGSGKSILALALFLTPVFAHIVHHKWCFIRQDGQLLSDGDDFSNHHEQLHWFCVLHEQASNDWDPQWFRKNSQRRKFIQSTDGYDPNDDSFLFPFHHNIE